MNVILLNQLRADLLLVMRIFIIHIEHFLFGSDILFRVTVTVQAERHGERLRFIGEVHFVNARMTTVAADALRDVDTMIKIDEVRQVIDFVPNDRLTVCIAVTNGLQERAVRPNLRMTAHADLGRGHARMCGNLDRSVTIAAIDAEFFGMVLVTKRHRLIKRNHFLIDVA